MNLRSKMYLVVLITWLIILIAISITSYVLILSDYRLMEKEVVKNNYLRATEALSRSRETLNALVSDWAHWNDTYSFLQNKNKQYISDNLESKTSYQDLKLNFILFFDDNQQFIYGKGFDLKTKEFIKIPEDLLKQIYDHKNTILRHDKIREFVNGFIQIPEGYVLFSSFPVSDSEAVAKPNGNIIMAYYLEKDRIDNLSKILGVKVNLLPLTSSNDSLKLALPHLANNEKYYASARNEELVDLFMYIRNIDNKPIGVLHLEIPRTTYQQGLKTIYNYLIMVGLIGIIILVIFEFTLKSVILDRINRYQKQLKHITQTHDFSKKIKLSGKDELYSMAKSSNEMLEVINSSQKALEETIKELQKRNIDLNREIEEHKKSKIEVAALNKQLVDTARRTGMAEIATSVLHNVGNILNSVNVSSQLLNEKLPKSILLQNLDDFIQRLKDPSHDYAKYLMAHKQGQKILAYLETLHESLREERDEAKTELKTIIDHVQHIKEVIVTQQTMNKSGLVETVSLSEQLDTAINMVGFDSNYIIEKQYGVLEPISIDKAKLMQILVNLIRNAKDALLDNKNGDKKIILVTKDLPNNEISIEVIDNGVGVEPNLQVKIFSLGFTTKKHGHGYGLHTSALQAKELGGSIQVFSEGAGKGSIFKLIFPKN